MATIYKVLGQSNPTALTNTNIYTVPAATSAIVSTIFVCNRAYGETSFRIAIRPGGATLANQHYINFDSPILGAASLSITSGITLGAGDIITVYSESGFVAFSIFGSEIN